MSAEVQEGYLAPRNFVTIKEAARYMGVSYVFLWRRMGSPEGPPAQKIGYNWKIPKEEFIEWAKQPIIR